MKTTGKSLCLALALVLLLSCGAWTGTTEAAAETVGTGTATAYDAQISLIFAQRNTLLQDDGNFPWYYSVMDFDHDGKLEFFAAAQHPTDRSTNLKVWEVNADMSGMTDCIITKDPEESFPDIITDTADTYHDTQTDTWSYMFYDNVVVSPANVYTVKCSVSMRDGMIGYQPYAVEHSELVNSMRYVTHMNSNGLPISAAQYNAAGTDSFVGAKRSTTNFDWFKAEELKDESRLADSFAVFAGTKAAPETSPIAAPPILQHDELAPVQGQAGDVGATYMIIIKNPTSEKKKTGQSLSFVAGANVYDSAVWTFVSPDGGEYDIEFFQAHFVYSDIGGAYGPTLTISNLDSYMDGWGAYCTFYFKGQTARTSTAWINLIDV